jgi:dienelactone hydrolase
MERPGRRWWGVVLAGAVLAGCAGATTNEAGSGPGGDQSNAPSTVPIVTRPFTFETWDETLVDPTRPTPAGAETPAAAERTLVTTIYLPDAPGPLPWIVFAHGLSGHPDKFSALLTTWAEAGYAVAAPAFPTTNSEVPGSSKNFNVAFEQPDDVSFVIDEMLKANDDPSSPLHGRLDADRLGVAGLSLGGATTYGVVFSECCRDDRIKAAAVYAGAMLPLSGEVELDGHVPLLIVHGDADPALVYSNATDAYARASAPVWFVTLLGAAHAQPFEDWESDHDEMVEQLTTDWWDATIGGDPTAIERFERDAVVDGLSTLQQKS